jgi:cellulose 1,4-beta-cellobiosidase
MLVARSVENVSFAEPVRPPNTDRTGAEMHRIIPLLLGATSIGFAVSCAGGTQGGPVSPSAAGASANPFEGARFYVNPEYAAKVESTAVANPGLADRIRKVESFPTAVWLDSIAKAKTASHYLDEALAVQKQSGQPVVTLFVMYDLPSRDCAAIASAGELDLGAGIERYKKEFVDPIAAQFRAHPLQRVAVLLEPDSLGNVATNLNMAKCAAAEQAYKHSIAYAVRTLALPNVAVYLDAAHAGWLGWDGNRAKIARIFKEVLDEAGGASLVRGFATNVSNFNTLADGDGKRMEPSDPCPDELTYVQKLSASLAEVGISGKGFVIDTSRDGRGGIRSKWGVWCNAKGAGLGERPRASPAPLVDAYYWVKPPGESDGASDPSTPGYDAACSTPDSAAGAPHAGQWFTSYFLELVQNANPPI